MGKKAKIGKQRRDRFYQLARESGYRSRAAFKLLQLNRRFQFLDSSSCLIDLCAAPGSWLQVAQQHMPVSSRVVGVDLVPIAPIPGVKTFQCDITTDQCRGMLTKELGKGAKADVVLNDGAPNMGSAWEQDAFDQVSLCLKALSLACHFLREGGWFLTKVFRSKDYSALLWVCQQLFNHVNATKPEASRLESAEIFIVCRGYLAPDKIDPKILDPRHVFQEAEIQTAQPLKLEKAPDKIQVSQLLSAKKKRRAEGYSDTSHPLVYRPVPLSEFVTTQRHLEVLKGASCLEVDVEMFKKHPDTSDEVLAYFKDIQVLGRSELRNLLKWREQIRAFIDQSEERTHPASDSDGADVSEGESELKLLNLELSMEKRRKKKRERKEELKRRLKLAESLKMFPGGTQGMGDISVPLFQLSAIKNQQQLDDMMEGSVEPTPVAIPATFKPPMLRHDWDMRDEETIGTKTKTKNGTKSRTKEVDVVPPDYHSDTLLSSEDDNPLLTESLGERGLPSRSEIWFERGEFSQSNLRTDRDEDIDIRNAVAQMSKPAKTPSNHPATADMSPQQQKMESDSSAESDTEGTGTGTGTKQLDAVGLALAEEMFRSKSSLQDITDAAYNRHANRDDNLDIPDWFLDDEEKHSYRILPVTKQQVEFYKDRQKEIDKRPIKKIVEAKAKRRFKAAKKVETARKILDNLPDSNDVMAEKEKIDKIKKLYRRAGQIRDRGKVTYVVSKKSGGGQSGRPKGVKGRYKRVDARMKKDRRNVSLTDKRKGNKGRKKSRR